ncbi:Vacuolar protein sorting-associated protein SNF8 [Cymbomonas tetramitiformis]|uniref:Vacuolar protein sorting-associated protein n=1 Tax=Cymbomonas tetramitiformis TaxID=36881 RepID=A0AAE0KYP1_9CHLO|nr:Vacuolar protein sorting-associated protein SNF8 [Cymbomonas tetramitiformis]
MRRRPGLQGLQQRAVEKDRKSALGEDVARNQVERVKEQLSTFRSALEEFALKHRNDIKQNPVFRAQFHQMCASLGVDPLASNKGLWAELLGIGDFYYELAVQIAEACLTTRELNGGLMDIRDVLSAVQRRRGGIAERVSKDDIMRAIDTLKGLGSGFTVIKVGSHQLLRSVPSELNTDHNILLEFAQDKGYITEKEVNENLGWPSRRFDLVMDGLLKDQVAMIDDGAPDHLRRYWFPCLSLAHGKSLNPGTEG